jgi:DNA-directed RNA polymerase subunit E'/Rpb7
LIGEKYIKYIYEEIEMLTKSKKREHREKEKDSTIYGVYTRSILNKRVTLSITEIGRNLKQNLEEKIVANIAGKCIHQGFIKPGSIKIVKYSCGEIVADYVQFNVTFECMICLPTEGALVECVTKTVTKAGIHAQVVDADKAIPLTVFIARDHHYMDERLNKLKEGDAIIVRIIGIRYELNDMYICAIAKLVNQGSVPKLQLGGDIQLNDVDQGVED